jgi:hypothetical protein
MAMTTQRAFEDPTLFLRAALADLTIEQLERGRWRPEHLYTTTALIIQDEIDRRNRRQAVAS